MSEAYEDEDDLVFRWDNGRPVLPDYLTKRIGKEQAGLGPPGSRCTS